MPDHRRYERGPDTIALLTSLAIGGALLTLLGVVPGSVASIASPVIGLAWSAALTAGSTTALIGILSRVPARGWGLEAIGRGCLSPILLGYSVALGDAATNPGTWFLVILFAALSVASAFRCYQTIRRLREYRAALRGAIS